VSGCRGRVGEAPRYAPTSFVPSRSSTAT
jgi:hypothetical protein